MKQTESFLPYDACQELLENVIRPMWSNSEIERGDKIKISSAWVSLKGDCCEEMRKARPSVEIMRAKYRGFTDFVKGVLNGRNVKEA